MARKQGAQPGNKNAKGKKIMSSNFAGFLTGVLQPRKFNERSSEFYKKRGAGVTGHRLGTGLRKIATLGLERKK